MTTYLRKIVHLILIATAATSTARSADDYTNPVYDRDFPDPFVIRHDGRFFAYGTQTRSQGFQLLESDDLVHWRARDLDFKVPWAREHYWAPEVVAYQDRFYLTYSALDPETKKHHIAIATADRPEGPFTHRVLLVRGDDNRIGVIDANIVFDDNKPYLIYCEEDPRRIVARPLREDLLAVAGNPVELLRPDLEWEHGVTEAPTLLKRDGKYHLFYSGGPFQGPKRGPWYAMGHAQANSLLGPYIKAKEPLLKSKPGHVYGPGHQCVIKLEDDTWWVLYHAWDAKGEPRYGRNPRGRTLRLDRLQWDGDTPRVIGPTTEPQPTPAVRPVG